MSATEPVAGLTVEAVLRLEVFERGSAIVLAGLDHLDRVVRWVHSAEISDIARFLTGGELLLTAGSGIGRDEQEHRAYVRSVAGAGIAALAVELSGRVFAEMPEAVISESATVGLPLIAFSREVPFVEVAAQVYSCIRDRRIEELVQEEEAGRAFNDLLAAGEDYLAVVQELADRIARPCVLEDKAHQMLAYCGHGPIGVTRIDSWSRHSRVDHGGDDGSDTVSGCTREPIVLRGEVWGWIHVLDTESGVLFPLDRRTVGRAATAVAITLLNEQLARAKRAQRDAALVSRLMLGDISGEGFVARALELGRDVRDRSFLVVVIGQERPRAPFDAPQFAATVTRLGGIPLLVDGGDRITAVIGLPPRRAESPLLDALRGVEARVGVSRTVPAPELSLAVQQASTSYAATSDTRRVVRFEDLGILRLVFAGADGPALAIYVEDELGAVLRHDARSANALLPTLRALLDCDGGKSQAAQRLFIQRRTLYYRLERLSTLLGVDLDDPGVRHRLQVALSGLDLLEQRSEDQRSRG